MTAISPSYPAGELRVAVGDGVGARRRAPIGPDARGRARGVRAQRRAALLPLQGGVVRGPRSDRAERHPGHGGARGRERRRPRRVPTGDLGGRTRRHPQPAARVRRSGREPFGRSLERSASASPTSPRSHACPRGWSSGSASRPSCWLGSTGPKRSSARSGSTWSAFATAAVSRRSRCRPPRSIGSSQHPALSAAFGAIAALGWDEVRVDPTGLPAGRRTPGLSNGYRDAMQAVPRKGTPRSRAMSFAELPRLTKR